MRPPRNPPLPGPTETEAGPTRAAVILPHERPQRSGVLEFSPPGSVRAAEARLAEAVGLAASIGVTIVRTAIHPLRERRPSTLMGEGQVAMEKKALEEQEVEVVVVDAALSPVQQRNLERAWGVKVIDRTGLILEIFGERARTREGSLQVELAHLSYQRSRLVRSWTHLERQRGGAGFLGGPGESQMEIDRRLIDDRIVRLKKELEQVRRTRGLHRGARARVPYPIVALVGYTNAGKSTLFNALTGAGVYAQDQLFATLDPTMRQISLPSGRTAILSDTVGFISELPTQLVEAFRATLEEVAAADIILHVRDAAHPDTQAQRADVLHVLSDMAEGADAALDENWQSRVIEVLNKADLLPPERVSGMAVSALNGDGLDGLLAAVDARLGEGQQESEHAIAAGDGARIAWLHRHAEVLETVPEEEVLRIRVRMSATARARFHQLPPFANDA